MALAHAARLLRPCSTEALLDAGAARAHAADAGAASCDIGCGPSPPGLSASCNKNGGTGDTSTPAPPGRNHKCRLIGLV